MRCIVSFHDGSRSIQGFSSTYLIDRSIQLLLFAQVVLSACSSYFQKLLLSNPCKHPTIIMPQDVCFNDLKFIIEFVYRGEIDVSQAELQVRMTITCVIWAMINYVSYLFLLFLSFFFFSFSLFYISRFFFSVHLLKQCSCNHTAVHEQTINDTEAIPISLFKARIRIL